MGGMGSGGGGGTTPQTCAGHELNGTVGAWAWLAAMVFERFCHRVVTCYADCN